MTTASRTTRLPWTALFWWGVVGAAGSFGVIALLTVGIFVLIGVAFLMAVGLAVPGLRERGWSGLVVGVAAAPLFLAWLNREGPGEVCRVYGSTTECAQRWSPWPFLLVALALVAAGLILARIELRSHRPLHRAPQIGPPEDGTHRGANDDTDRMP